MTRPVNLTDALASFDDVDSRWAGEGLSSARRHYPNVPRPLRRGILHGCASRLNTASTAFALCTRARHSLAPLNRQRQRVETATPQMAGWFRDETHQSAASNARWAA